MPGISRRNGEVVEAWCKEMTNQEQRNWDSRRGEGVPRVQLKFKSLLRWIRKCKAFVANRPEIWTLNMYFSGFFALIFLTKVP